MQPSEESKLDSVKGVFAWVYAGAMAVLTAVAEGATSVEPDRLVWILGLAGAIFGAALLPSTQVWRTGVKLMLGWIIAGVASTPLAASHYLPAFFNVHVAALWLGFSGPAIFLASTEGGAIYSRVFKGKTP